MNIISHAENTICIELTRDDMEQLDITYDELDYSNVETRRVLWTLLDKARVKLGREIHITQKMLIEVLPCENGGCTIFFTVSDTPEGKIGKKQLVRLPAARVICTSDNIENMCLLSGVLSDFGQIKKSELFTNGSAYRMIITPERNAAHSIESIVCEYSDICSDSEAPVTYEHWKLLASPNAVEMLGL